MRKGTWTTRSKEHAATAAVNASVPSAASGARGGGQTASSSRSSWSGGWFISQRTVTASRCAACACIATDAEASILSAEFSRPYADDRTSKRSTATAGCVSSCRVVSVHTTWVHNERRPTRKLRRPPCDAWSMWSASSGVHAAVPDVWMNANAGESATMPGSRRRCSSGTLASDTRLSRALANTPRITSCVTGTLKRAWSKSRRDHRCRARVLKRASHDRETQHATAAALYVRCEKMSSRTPSGKSARSILNACEYE